MDARTTTRMRPQSASQLTAAGLQSTSIDDAITALRAVVEHRDDLVKHRTQTINRLHVLLTKLVPAGAPS
jgi:transposase